MFRKALFTVSALTVLAAAALAPTAASAGWKGHHGHHGHHGWGKSFYYGGPSFVAYTGYNTCWVKRWVDTPYGPRLKRMYVCY
jgi:hypothetical protein